MISGDNAATVGAIAERAGIPGAETPVDARSEDPVAAVERASVFGRVNPDQKQDMVDALRGKATRGHDRGRVNDVLALKRADLGSRWARAPRRPGLLRNWSCWTANGRACRGSWPRPAGARQHRTGLGCLLDQEHVRAADRAGDRCGGGAVPRSCHAT